jgi:hypothetical protein
LQGEIRGFFERRGRECFAKGAKKKYKNKTKKRIQFYLKQKFFNYFFFIPFGILSPLLRSLRNLRALCVQNIRFRPQRTLTLISGVQHAI